MEQLLPIAPAGKNRRNSFGPFAPICSRGSNSEQFIWSNFSKLLPREQFGAIRLLPIAPAGAIRSNSFEQLLPREQFRAISLEHLLPIAPAGAIRSNLFGPFAPRGSNSEQLVWSNCSQLLPREQFGAICLEQLLPIALAGAIRSNSFGPFAPNCSRMSNSDQFVWSNCSQKLPLEHFGEIRLEQ